MSGDHRRAADPEGHDRRRAERREDLLGAAVEAIRRLGPGATMDQLAKAGGVTKPILYRHFGDRDGLITAIAKRFATDLVSSVTTPLTASDVGPRELLRSTVDSYIGFIERDTELYRFMVQHFPAREGGIAQVNALVELIVKQVALVIAEGLRAVGGDSEPAVPWAYGIVGLVHEAGNWWVDDQTMSRQTLVDHLVALLWDGLGAAAAPRPGGRGVGSTA